MKKKWLNIALLAALLGLVCAGISLKSYFRVQTSGMLEESFCSINETFNCDAVEASSYAAIAGIPIAGLGLIYYIFILGMTAYARFGRGHTYPALTFTWWTTWPAVAFAMFLMYISGWVLNTICLTCVGMYIANFLLFITLFVAMGVPLKQFFSFFFGYWFTVFTGKKKNIDFSPRFWMYLLAVVVVFGIGLIFVSSAAAKIERPTKIEMQEYLDRHFRQSKYDIKINESEVPVWGKRGAPITIIEFSDFKCPFCKVAAFSLKPFLSEYKKDIAFYFVNYPLDNECNHYMENQMHPGACTAARAAICSNTFGKFWEYHDLLFRKKGDYTIESVSALAKSIGIPEQEFVECVNSGETDRRLMDDIESARKIYITGTPSVFVNNRQLKVWRSPDILRAVIEKELEMPKNEQAPAN